MKNSFLSYALSIGACLAQGCNHADVMPSGQSYSFAYNEVTGYLNCVSADCDVTSLRFTNLTTHQHLDIRTIAQPNDIAITLSEAKPQDGFKTNINELLQQNKIDDDGAGQIGIELPAERGYLRLGHTDTKKDVDFGLHIGNGTARILFINNHSNVTPRSIHLPEINYSVGVVPN